MTNEQESGSTRLRQQAPEYIEIVENSFRRAAQGQAWADNAPSLASLAFLGAGHLTSLGFLILIHVNWEE